MARREGIEGSDGVDVGPIDDLEDGSGREVTVAGRAIALFRLGDRVVALAGRCPHQGARLAEGLVDPLARTVTCPRRGCLRWRFDLETGASTTGLAVACPTYLVRVEAGEVRVLVPPWP